MRKFTKEQAALLQRLADEEVGEGAALACYTAQWPIIEILVPDDLGVLRAKQEDRIRWAYRKRRRKTLAAISAAEAAEKVADGAPQSCVHGLDVPPSAECLDRGDHRVPPSAGAGDLVIDSPSATTLRPVAPEVDTPRDLAADKDTLIAQLNAMERLPVQHQVGAPVEVVTGMEPRCSRCTRLVFADDGAVYDGVGGVSGKPRDLVAHASCFAMTGDADDLVVQLRQVAAQAIGFQVLYEEEVAKVARIGEALGLTDLCHVDPERIATDRVNADALLKLISTGAKTGETAESTVVRLIAYERLVRVVPSDLQRVDEACAPLGVADPDVVQAVTALQAIAAALGEVVAGQRATADALQVAAAGQADAVAQRDYTIASQAEFIAYLRRQAGVA